MKKLRKYFDSLTPPQKKVVVMGAVMVVVGIMLYFGYSFRSGGDKDKVVKPETQKINIDTKLLDKAYNDSIQEEFKDRDDKMADLKRMLEDLGKKVDANGVSIGAGSSGDPGATVKKDPLKTGMGQSVPFPPPPDSTRRGSARSVQEIVDPPKAVGGIEIIGDGAKALRPELKERGKKRRTVYLPPSFMDATLLTGFSAATMQSAKTFEKPLLLRVKDISILPNDVKTDLKGCFVMASAYGDLADERAHARLVNLSCVGKNGESVIDAPIKGFIVDEDGKIGLSGNVVTRVGALLGRSVIAGFFGGAGDAFKAASTTTSVSSLGATQTIDSGDILDAGIGSGLSEGFGELQKFYLDMAKQTFPVIEVGATKMVTIVIEQGVELEIEDYCIGGFDKCAEK